MLSSLIFSHLNVNLNVLLFAGIAKTGSGKTLAFLLPMYRHVLDQPDLDREDGPIGNKICSVLSSKS